MAFDYAKIVTDLFREAKGQESFDVNLNDFMQNGAGRFAVGRQFGMVNDFFTADFSRQIVVS